MLISTTTCRYVYAVIRLNVITLLDFPYRGYVVVDIISYSLESVKQNLKYWFMFKQALFKSLRMQVKYLELLVSVESCNRN